MELITTDGGSKKFEENLSMVVTLKITERDMQRMKPPSALDNIMLDHFRREEASVEERLMGLQVMARLIKEGSL